MTEEEEKLHRSYQREYTMERFRGKTRYDLVEIIIALETKISHQTQEEQTHKQESHPPQ
jgi:hypothetical protein